ncbi:hypothetical protein AKO42_08585 [Salmonella enterica subsp. enterica serovar Nottingham]|nr:hypothetical protein AKO42_08585 [Salmonella enterica subsp. enterica serovar Nottingham]
MSLMAVCQKIENYMCAVYKINEYDRDMINLVTCRAMVLTRFHLLLTNHSRDSLLSFSNYDSLAILLYQASEKRITDPLSVFPALALHILEDALYDSHQECDYQFLEAEKSMREWFVEYRERQQKLSSEYSKLPQLRWNDLPNALFDLTPKN